MIDPVTRRFEILQYNYSHAAKIDNLVEQALLCIYTRPTIITQNQGNELLGHAFKNDLIQK